MIEAPAVFTIVLNWNGLTDTRECLNSLRSADYPANRVVAIDNGSEADEASAIEAEFGDFVEVIRNPENLGFAGGMNIGIKRALAAGAEYVLLLNNDVTVDPSFLTAMVEAAGRHANLAAACPKAYFKDRPEVIYSTGGSVNLWTGTARQIGRGQRDAGQFEGEAVRDYADGLCMLIPATAIEKAGLLDEDYFLYWEETDWCFRARAKGLRSYYVPGAKVWHKAARSLWAKNDFHYQYERNALMFVRKRGSPLQLATALLAHLLVYAPSYLIRRRIGRARAELRAVLWNAGLRNHPRQRPLV